MDGPNVDDLSWLPAGGSQEEATRDRRGRILEETEEEEGGRRVGGGNNGVAAGVQAGRLAPPPPRRSKPPHWVFYPESDKMLYQMCGLINHPPQCDQTLRSLTPHPKSALFSFPQHFPPSLSPSPHFPCLCWARRAAGTWICSLRGAVWMEEVGDLTQSSCYPTSVGGQRVRQVVFRVLSLPLLTSPGHSKHLHLRLRPLSSPFSLLSPTSPLPSGAVAPDSRNDRAMLTQNHMETLFKEGMD